MSEPISLNAVGISKTASNATLYHHVVEASFLVVQASFPVVQASFLVVQARKKAGDKEASI